MCVCLAVLLLLGPVFFLRLGAGGAFALLCLCVAASLTPACADGVVSFCADCRVSGEK